jgi:two-component system, OmpR family, alkaline phosphatase synthesis response regulator PhoP
MNKAVILLVEDDEELRELVKLRLESYGHKVVAASTGTKGLDEAHKVQPQCVILDVFLPDMDGLTVLKRLKAPLDVETGKPSPTKDIPVIVVTGKAPMIENMTRIEGASDFFLKPVDVEKLTARVNELVMKGNYEREWKH